jgi:putative FmdB family regulatory protein
MPAYDYRCLDCQHEYEKREGFDAPALQKCPVCGGTARRVIHAPPVVFKGSGFYVTDSRKAAPEAQSEAKGESPSPKDKDASSTTSETSSKSSPTSDKSAAADKAAATG